MGNNLLISGWTTGLLFCMTLQTASGERSFYIFYHLYDGNGIAVLRRREYETYNAGLKRILDRAGAHTMLSAGIFIEGRYSGMILLVNTETEREWSRADCAAVSEMARIVASGIKNTSLLIEAKTGGRVLQESRRAYRSYEV